MQRVVLFSAATAAIFVACAAPPRFQDMRTPSGEFCTDMPIFAGKTQPDREFHRLEPVQSEPGARTEPERLRSLRKSACMAGGDAVIEAIEEEIRLPDASYGKVATGTAIVWIRREGSSSKPIDMGAHSEADKGAEPVPAADPNPPKEATPINTAAEVKSAPAPQPTAAATPATTAAAPTPTPTTSATGSTSTTKTKTTTKTTTKK
ncbi:hypothetical protein [Polyangium sorediatum]|uniref:Lipoprotein n=1 Tax=Polyangium sorediatum TaxID=889274 RepID=A0ABT6NW18_9BACT|nr:hypothetical protein [Polyangium sorediatum]MDI1432540.1 hypothetical protein [Polyangium sorediatum]